MADRVRERRLFPPEYSVRQIPEALEGVAEKVLSLTVFVDLHLRVETHHVFNKVEVAERHPRLKRIHRNAAVCPQNVVHVNFPDPLLRLFLKRVGVRREIRVFIAEKFIRDLAREQHSYVRFFMNRLADKVHSHARPDRRDIVRSEGFDHCLKRSDYLIRRHEHFCVIRADELRDLPRVFQVDRVPAHADGKSSHRLRALSCRDGAHERRVKPSREEESDLRVRDEPFFDPFYQFFANVPAGRLNIVAADVFDGGDVAVAHKFPVFPVVPRRKRRDPLRKPHQIFRFARKHYHTVFVEAVVERADPHRVSRRDELARSAVVNHARELRVEHFEHAGSVLEIHRKQYLAVAAAPERIPFPDQLLALFLESVQLAVANGKAAAKFKRLHSRVVKAHYREPVKAEYSLIRFDDSGVVRSPRFGSREALFKRGRVCDTAAVTENRTQSNLSYSTS